MTSSRPTFADALVGALLAVVCTVLYSATALGRIYGNDGAMLAKWTALPERAYHQYHNTLYLPAGELLRHLLPRGLLSPPDDPVWLAKALSIVPAAVGVAFTFFCCRLLGAGRAASVFATTLLAVSPVLWFFGAAIEVHALHFAIVACCAWLTLVAPWQRPALALTITAAAFVIPYLSHESAPTLGPGWILLVQCARRRRGEPFSWRALFGIGVVLLAALLLGHMLVQWRRGLGFGFDFGDTMHLVGVWRRGFSMTVLGEALLLPYALLTPLLVLAGTRRGVDPWLRACVGVTLLPLLGCVLWWGIPEHGGYLLGPGFLLAALIAALWQTLPRRLAVEGGVVAVVVQTFCGWHAVQDFDREGFQLADRAARVQQTIGDRGFVLSCNDNAPPVTIWLPGVIEVDLVDTLADKMDLPLDKLFADSLPALQLLAANERFVLDRSYLRRDDTPPRLREYMARFEQWAQDGWTVTESDDPSWPLWLLTRK